MTTTTTIAIAGGGIGGLTAAIALEQAGFDVTVYEQAPAIDRVGAGVGVWPNAVRVLDRLGVGQAVRAYAVRFDGGLLATDGRTLQAQPAELIHDRYGAPMISLARWQLQEALLEHVGPDRVQLGRVATGYHQDGPGVELRFADGGTARADVLVGADGVRSAIRRQLLGDGPPRYRGDTSWRAIIDAPQELRPVRSGFETFGPGPRFGMLPAADDKVMWFATEDRPHGEQDGPDVTERLLGTFGEWHHPIPLLISSTDVDRIVRADIYHRTPTRRWVDGRVALLGDAAHPMGPDGGQGACQAIEDAGVLADALADAGSVQRGLQAYERARRRRVALIVLGVAALSRAGRMRQPALCAARDRLLAAVPDRMVVRQMDALVGS